MPIRFAFQDDHALAVPEPRDGPEALEQDVSKVALIPYLQDDDEVPASRDDVDCSNLGNSDEHIKRLFKRRPLLGLESDEHLHAETQCRGVDLSVVAKDRAGSLQARY